MQKLEKIGVSLRDGNREEFLHATLSFLSSSISKAEIGYLIELLSSKQNLHFISKNLNREEISKIALAFRDKYYELIISRSDVAESAHIKIYSLFRLCDIDKDTRLEPFSKFIEANKNLEGLGDLEKVYLLMLKFTLDFLDGKKEEALENFLEDLSILNIHKVETTGINQNIITLLEILDGHIEILLEVISDLLSKERYFEFSKEQRRSIFNRSLHTFWNVPIYYNDKRWMNLYPKWREIFYEHLHRGEIDEAMYLHFFIYHKMGNHFQTQKEWRSFNEEISKYASSFYQKYALQNSLTKPKDKIEDGKILIGVVQDRIVNNSPYKVQYSLLKSLNEDENFKSRYKIKIYLMSYVEKSTNEVTLLKELVDLGIDIVDGGEPFYKDGYYYSHLDKALLLREKIIRDGVDILISPNNGYDISDFLISTKSAPKILFWSHGNYVYDIKGIDEKITHIYQNDVELEGYRFRGFSVKMEAQEQIPEDFISKERAKYGKDRFILGTIGRLLKIDSDSYLSVVAKILKENPNSIYIAAGGGNIKSIKEKLERLGVLDRFYFPGFVNAKLYGEIIDLWLNTFPLVQGESLNEYIKLKKPFISMVENPKLQWIERYKESPRRYLYPCSEDDYVDYASKLIRDPSLAKSAVEIFLGELEIFEGGAKSFIKILDEQLY